MADAALPGAMSSSLARGAAARRLRILMVTESAPFPPIWGTGMRNYQLLRHLAARHDVTLVTHATSTPGALDALEAVCDRVVVVEYRGGRPNARLRAASFLSSRSYRASLVQTGELQAAIDSLIRGVRYDIVQLESSVLGHLDVGGGGPVVVLDEHNIEFEVLWRTSRAARWPLRKLYYLSEYAKCRREEIRAWRRVDGCSLTSEREERILRRLVPRRATAVVPNGVDAAYFRPSGREPEPDEIVFTGLMSYRPNVDAVSDFVREILPRIRRARPQVRFTIVGADPRVEVRRLAGTAIVVTGAVADVRPYLERASVVVVPLRVGGGTRLKIGEALAMERPIVSTQLGAEGIDVQHGRHLLIADDPAAFAISVVRLLEDRDLARRIAQSGREFAEQRLSWDASVARLELLYDELLSVGKRRSAELSRLGT